MDAHGHGVVPGEADEGECASDGGEGRQDAQVLCSEPLSEEAYDAEEARVPGGEDDDRSFRTLYARERLREIPFEEDSTLGLHAQRSQVTFAPGDQGGLSEQAFGLRAQRLPV